MVDEIYPGIYTIDLDDQQRIATLPVNPAAVYGERIWHGYRIWDPTRSKFAAFLLKQKSRQYLNLFRDGNVLYLGAATGTTVSHVSDIVSKGLVYAVEFSSRAMRDLLKLCEARENIVPILADAARPEMYSTLVEPVDIIYQDVAQRNQAEIATLNAARYLKPGGCLMLMIKTRSIDVTASPKDVYRSEIEELKGMEVQYSTDLQPYHHDHWAVIAKKTKEI
ncbi:MAG: fibrillarin-like rRNA/tRNA 2'-O-methyltransferase [Methanotrichaceae archaeon]